MEDSEVLVIGAGPAGLSAALYLARFRRRVLVVDAGASRARLIPVSHNYPGFDQGISGEQLLQRLRRHAAHYGVASREGRIDALTREGGGFRARLEGRSARFDCVVLASGVVDRLPPLPGIEDAVRAGLVRLCAICDGYEAAGKRVAVLGAALPAIRHACYMRGFAEAVTALVPAGEAVPESARCEARDGDIEVLQIEGEICLADAGIEARSAAGIRRFDVVYPVLGCRRNSTLATALGALSDDDGDLQVDEHMQTSVPRLYAVGDVVKAINQISVSVGHGAIAATAIHRVLREMEGAARRPAQA